MSQILDEINPAAAVEPQETTKDETPVAFEQTAETDEQDAEMSKSEGLEDGVPLDATTEEVDAILNETEPVADTSVTEGADPEVPVTPVANEEAPASEPVPA